jgi:Zn-dependent M32 family carboxypeptidase
MRLNGWDPFFEGWGGEDNEMGYRIVLNGMDIVYTNYVKAFHVWRKLSPEEEYSRFKSVLRNMDYMCKKFPELSSYDRLIMRRTEVEELMGKFEKHNGQASGRPDILNRLNQLSRKVLKRIIRSLRP